MGLAERVSASVLGRLGGPSTLDGVDCGNVHVARGVNLEMDDVVVRRCIATIANGYAPKAGQVLVHPEGTWTLDRLLRDNGANSRWILV